MITRSHLRQARLAGLAAVVTVAVTSCGQLNRTSTINSVTTVAGDQVASTISHLLADSGVGGAHIVCSKTMIVRSGSSNTCRISGLRTGNTIRFKWNVSHGMIHLHSATISNR